MKLHFRKAIILMLVAALGGGYYFLNRQNQTVRLTQIPDYRRPTTQPVDNSFSTLIPTVQPKTASIQTYQVPSGWQKYSDSESGITVYYPPQYTAKYNPNRGFGVNFRAGSYLVNESGDIVLDFYVFPYNGGSRRQSFYDVVEFDGPEDMSKFTVSIVDVVLNTRTYLKLISNYWATYASQGNQVFFLTPQGDKMYYFTYPASFESNSTDYKNILTIIATSVLSVGRGTSSNQYVYCYARPDSGNINNSWEARIVSGDMEVTQRTDKQLKQGFVDKSKISLSGNPQNPDFKYFSITDFDIYVDSSRKGSYQDAFVIKIKKGDVDRIAQDTPSSIPTVAIMSSINGGVETTDGKFCKADLYGYYAPKP